MRRNKINSEINSLNKRYMFPIIETTIFFIGNLETNELRKQAI